MSSKKSLILLSFIAAIFLVVSGAAFGLLQTEKYVATRIRKELKKVSAVADVQFEKVKINPVTRMVYLNGVVVKSPSLEHPVSAKSVGLGGLDWDSLVAMVKTRKPVVPRHARFVVYGLTIPAAWTGETASTLLAQLGYESLEVSTSIDVNLDLEKKTFGIEPFLVEMADAGRLEFSISFENAVFPPKEDIELLRRDPRSFIALRLPEYEDVALRSLSIRYHDESLVPKAVKFLVSQGEDHPVALLDLALEQPKTGRKVAAAQTSTFVHRSLVALRGFFESPGTIGIHSTLSKPVPFSALLDDTHGGSIEEIARKLSLDVERE